MRDVPPVPSTWSIRRRVLLWVLVGMVLVFAANLASGYYATRQAADRAYDRLLLASASAIAEHVGINDGRVRVDLPYAALDMLATAAQDRVFYSVSGPGGKFVTGYPDLPSVSPEGLARPTQDPVFFNADFKGSSVRVVSLGAFVAGGAFSGYARVTVAQTRGDRNALTFDLLQQSAFWTLLIALSGGFAAWIGISLGLRPLKGLREALGRRSPEDVRPVLHNVPREIKPLVIALNEMLSRLDGGLMSMRRFISDASHQLRTPLAALQAQTELALREEDPEAIRLALRKVNLSARRTSRLAHQLLSHARATENVRAFEQVDLAAIAREAIAMMDPKAREKTIDLGYEGQESLSFFGDRTLLGEMVLNLIDNALRYSPEGSVVTISGENRDTEIVLSVEDSGPGISQEQRQSVFERFVRLAPNDSEGCGLGLSIVREIVDLHGGEIALGDSKANGLRVVMIFDQPPRKGG